MTIFERVSHMLQTFVDSFIGRFFITFLILHSIHYFSALSHSHWCLDSSVFGYFNSMISGHGPVCYLLLTVAHHAQSNIYQLLPAAFISSGIGYISKKSKGETPQWASL